MHCNYDLFSIGIHKPHVTTSPMMIVISGMLNSGGTIGVQIASSGPDEEWEQIKYGYLKMISSAKKSIYIQSPYFIPDQAFTNLID